MNNCNITINYLHLQNKSVLSGDFSNDLFKKCLEINGKQLLMREKNLKLYYAYTIYVLLIYSYSIY